MPDYRRFVRQWALVLGRFLAIHPRLLVPFARVGLDAWRCLKTRREGSGDREIVVEPPHREGRILARPNEGFAEDASPEPTGGQARATAVGRAVLPVARGLTRLNLAGACDTLLYVPRGYRPDRPARFVLMLHGATSVGLAALALLLPFADAANLIVLAPDAPRRTWDRVLGGFGPDVAFVDRALATVFARYAIDPSFVAIGGFSDGASYALALGLINGDLFTHVIAFSPGFLAPGPRRGQPRVFDSHGTLDEILPLSSSERIVATLRAAGYAVTFVAFDGPHVVPVDVARQAADWLLK